MIEITHKQAQRMIREEQDRQLPDEQWAMLQAHLEKCPECCAYQARLASHKHDLIRSLRARWSSVRGPQAAIDHKVMKIIDDRKKRKKMVIRAIPWALGVLLLFGYISYRTLSTPVEPPPPTATLMFGFVPAQTPTPKINSLDFRGLSALELHRDGNAEIYLLKVGLEGPELTNLTQNPAEDTAPAWSPDGEWIAFLSNRSGKNEVYVMNIAGSRLAKLTSEPQIDWQGPLEWSTDGSYIGLRGKRLNQDTGLNPTTASAWLYLVPLDGSQPLSLAATYGVQSPVRFSSSQTGFAFAGSRPNDSLVVGNYKTGWTGDVTLEDRQPYDLSPVLSGAFDWSLGGRNLIYVVNNPLSSSAESEIRFSQDLEVGDHLNFTGGGAGTIDRIDIPGKFRAVSWMPHSLIVASLAGSDANHCDTVRLKNAYNIEEHARNFPGLCVVGGLAENNWTSEGDWLVLIAHKMEESKIGLYALHLPDLDTRDTLNPGGGDFERLLDLSSEQPAGANQAAGIPTWAEPHVRPSGRMLSIEPKAVVEKTSSRESPGAGLATNNTSWVVYSVRDGQNSQIVRMHPDGTQLMKLTGSPREHSCPRISPDGKTIAYLSTEEGMRPGANEVYRMDMDGNNVQMLTKGFGVASARNQPYPHYDCPVWSPDGNWLAAVLRQGVGNYLAIIPVDEKANARYLKLETVSSLSAPIWVPDAPGSKQASQILLVFPQGVRTARLVAVDLTDVLKPATESQNAEDLAQPANVNVKLQLIGWHDIEGLTLSPDGQYLAGIVEYLVNLRDTNNTGISIAQLRVFNVDNFDLVGAKPLENFETQNAGRGSVFWLPDGWVGVARVTGLIGPEKTVFERFNPNQDQFEQVARFEDTISQPALNQANQLIFMAESGLWTIDLGSAQPMSRQLSGEAVSTLDWR